MNKETLFKKFKDRNYIVGKVVIVIEIRMK